MEGCIALFVSGREHFFREKACINCPIDKYCVCDGADVLFDIDGVLRKELVEVGRGVRMTQPLKVEKGFLTGGHIYASLSHKGCLLSVPERQFGSQITDIYFWVLTRTQMHGLSSVS